MAGQTVERALQRSQTECKNTTALEKLPHPVCSESSTPITNDTQLPDCIVSSPSLKTSKLQPTSQTCMFDMNQVYENK